MDVDFIFSATFIAEDKYLHFILDANFGQGSGLGIGLIIVTCEVMEIIKD